MYKEYKWTDVEVDSTTFLFPQLKKILSHDKNRCILDLGCGNGEIANELISEGYCVYGVDGSMSGVEIANKYNSGHFYVMNFEADGFPEELSELHFDTIISTEVLEHLYSPDSYMKLCSRILKPGGALILTTPYHGYLKNLILSVTGKWDTHLTPLWEGGHIKFWSRKTLTKLLSRNGFKVNKFLGCGRIPYIWKSMLIVATYTTTNEHNK